MDLNKKWIEKPAFTNLYNLWTKGEDEMGKVLLDSSLYYDVTISIEEWKVIKEPGSGNVSERYERIVGYSVRFHVTKDVTTPKGVNGGIAVHCVLIPISKYKSEADGYSVCNPNDTFDLEKGYEKALERALDNGHFNKEQRKVFWSGYFHALENRE